MTNVNYSLSLQLSDLLVRKNKKIVLAESCTGGGLAEEITAVQGSTAWFERGYVTYSNASKIEVLGVSPETLEMHGAVSEQTAKQMAKGALKHSHADISLSVTGIAGPAGGSPEKPVGTVWFALADNSGRCEARLGTFTSGRKQVRSSSIEFALKWLIDALR